MIELFERLNSENVPYCQWKSTYRLSDSFLGHTDFDILIAPSGISQINSILLELNYRAMLQPKKFLAGLTDYIGYDVKSKTRVHVHLHSKVVIGGQGVKTHILPLRESILSSSRVGSYQIPEISCELEIQILLIRILLKLGLKQILYFLVGRSVIPRDLSADLLSLLEKTSNGADVNYTLFEPVIPAELLRGALGEIVSKKQNFASLLIRKLRLLKYMQPWSIHTPMKYFIKSLVAETSSLVLRKKKRTGSKILVNGGLAIAFVGPDGSGKSSLVRKTADWLSWKLAVEVVYSGFKGTGIITRIYSKIVGLSGKLPDSAIKNKVEPFLKSHFYLKIHKKLSRRRNRGFRRAAYGSIVVFDRYPLKELDGVMDWRIPEAGCFDTGKTAALRVERILEVAPPVDILIFLDVDEEIALSRKPSHKKEVIQTKVRESKTALSTRLGLVTIEANTPLEETFEKVKEAIWTYSW